jgi:DNA topoisomerase-1
MAIKAAAPRPGNGLRYVTDRSPGIRRLRSGRGFRYIGPDGSIRDRDEIARIRALAIPPAWTDVWISADPRGHLQAVGRDARGRKQYRYHPKWRVGRDNDKYVHMLAFARRLPQIRERVEVDLARPGLPRERVLALVVRLLELTHLRVGNEAYARLNRSFGLSTLRDRHVQVRSSTIKFRFMGKSGKLHEVGIRDRRLARLIRRVQELPGQALFEYLDEEGERRAVGSDDVNDYLGEISGTDVTAKDFRTWAATVLAFRALRSAPTTEHATAARRTINAAIDQVAARLGNTRAVCRSAYVDPSILEAWEDGALLRVRGPNNGELDLEGPPTAEEEAAVLRLLQRRRRMAARKPPPAAHAGREPTSA